MWSAPGFIENAVPYPCSYWTSSVPISPACPGPSEHYPWPLVYWYVPLQFALVSKLLRVLLFPAEIPEGYCLLAGICTTGDNSLSLEDQFSSPYFTSYVIRTLQRLQLYVKYLLKPRYKASAGIHCSHHQTTSVFVTENNKALCFFSLFSEAILCQQGFGKCTFWRCDTKLNTS